MSRIVFALLVLLASFSSVARDYLLSSGATSADLPTCSSNNWLQSVSGGIRTYHCANGSVSLSSGDNITATSQAILSADAGFSLAGGNTIGSPTAVVDLVSSYGATSWQGSNNHLFGSYQATNTPVTFNNVNVQGSITTGGAIDVQGGSVGGDVRSNNHGITLENTSVQGAVFANGNIIIDNSSVSGSIETPNNSLTVTDSTITGSLTANGNIMVTRANVSGNITTPHNAITVLDSDIVGSLTANGDIKVTNSELKGDVTTSNNGIVITETNVVGDLSANGNIITDNSFVTGNITSTNNQVTLNNKSYILGNVTAGRPDWGTVNVNGGSTVTGVCQYRTVPDNACGITPALKCFNDNFNQSDLTQNWVTFKSSGDFTPKIVGNRLRLTEAVREQATAVTYQRIFPAAGNIVQVELDYYAWANLTGDGADGIALIFSDATVTPRTGGFGGSLGYARRNPTSTTPAVPGFAGGWLGIGLDEWGNFANPTEGRVGGVGFSPQSITVRGSEVSDYRYITHQTVSPDIDVRGTNTPGPGDRYLIEIDSRNANQVLLSIRRTNNNTTTTIFNQYSIPLNQQGAIPEEFFLSLAGSTGGSVNHHEIDNFRVCALNSRPVGPQINHFRITLPQQALTCDVADVSVRACANSDCSSTFTDPVTAYLKPNSLPSATGGWVNGSTLSLNSGIGLTQLRRNQAGTVEVGVSGSNPTALAFNNTKCSYNGSDFSENNCVVEFVDSGFVLDVPHAYANQSVTAKISAVSKDDVSQQCVPSFGDVVKLVSFWSSYINPNSSGFSVGVDHNQIGQSSNNATPINLSFNQDGEATFNLSYRDVGELLLHARFAGSGDEQGLLLEGETSFIRVPRALVVNAKNHYDSDGKCPAQDVSCSVFARAGEIFDLNIRAVIKKPIETDSSDFNDNSTAYNYQQQDITLQHTLLQPSSGRAGVLGVSQYTHELGEVTTVQQSVSEVGVFDFSLVPPTSYLGLDLIEAVLPIAVTSTGPIGRFIPAYFAVSPMTVTLAAACNSDENSFTYLGQPFAYANNPGLYLQPKSGDGSDTLNYLIGDWWRYNNQWMERAYHDLVDDLTIDFTNELTEPVTRQSASTSGVTLNDEQLSYQKPIDPMVPFNADFNLHLSIDDLRDSDGVCYRTSYSEDCLGYTFENIDQTMPLYWGRLTIENVDGPEMQGLQQKIISEYYTLDGFVTNSHDKCTLLPPAADFKFEWRPANASDENDLPVPSTITMLPETTPFTLDQGVRSLNYTAPGLGNRGVIKALLDLEEHGLSWLRRYNPQNGIWDDSVAGQVQFGIYSGSNRVIWWRETN